MCTWDRGRIVRFNLNFQYELVRDIELPPLYGSEALHLLVPKTVKVTHGEIGHSTIKEIEG